MSYCDAPPVAVVISIVALATVLYQWNQKPRLPLPPGPRRKFIVGNLMDFPSDRAWLTWEKMGKEYGPLTYLSMLGRSALIINSHEVAVDLLERRKRIYSDRVYSTMFMDLVGTIQVFYRSV
jgi:hypothetical protein